MTVPVSLDALLKHSRVMLLQGPMGPFFARLASYLRAHGQVVWKINFSGGDRLFYGGRGAHSYRGSVEQWPAWLAERLQKRRVQAIVLFGQSRQIHHEAIQVARALGIAVYVFEEGYIRPDYVTLECGGVNGASSLPREAEFYRSLPAQSVPQPQPTRQTFRRLALYAMLYSTASALLRRRYPHISYHRPIEPLGEALRWLRGGVRKLRYRIVERHEQGRLCAPERTRRWFLVPLQVHNDSQIRHHSRYRSMEAVIDEVMASFSRHAPAELELVFKHHPMDRAYCDFTRHIGERAAALGIAERVRYIHDQHLPTLLHHALGVVTVNSTSGLQALYHGTPVFTLGECLYAVPGLVRAGSLDEFWRAPGEVDAALYRQFREHLLRQTQLNASFYAQAPGLRERRPAARVPQRLALPFSQTVPALFD